MSCPEPLLWAGLAVIVALIGVAVYLTGRD